MQNEEQGSAVGSTEPTVEEQAHFAPHMQALADRDEIIETEDYVHGWFGLTYASYLTLPRSLLEAMPAEWQKRFVSMLQEAEEEFPKSWPPEGHYRVSLVSDTGQFMRDDLCEYRRPNTWLIESLRRKK